eukprot:c19635_g1_i1.p1 GENE.c19635_g1_i1~~c19635_g1_i1.p1  ORF type:complete len:309 (-),score=127.52 c19635_g1_i1:950-1849(-)
MSDHSVTEEVIVSHENINEWTEKNKNNFSPPVCNKLMHFGQLSIMFVGGPNTRTDFHIEEGSEFFFQLKGNMELPTIQQGVRKLVKINEGQVFLLPPRIPHSPQRQENTLGLVIERQRTEGEMDGLRWYTNFETCETVLFEKFFPCKHLGQDLVPIVKEYLASEEYQTKVPGKNVLDENSRPIKQDTTSSVPDPFNFSDFLQTHKETLANGGSVKLFGDDHPDKEFSINVIGGKSTQENQSSKYETWIYQHKGSATIETNKGNVTVQEGSCCIILPNVQYNMNRDVDSIGLVVIQNRKE